MRDRLKTILRSKSGMAYLDVVILVIVSMMVIVLALNVYSYFTLRSDMEYIAAKTAEAAALVGSIDENSKRSLEDNTQTESIREVFEKVCASEGYETDEYGNASRDRCMTLRLTAQRTYNNSKRVQLGDMITVEVACNTTFRGLGALSDAIPIRAMVEKTTLSRVYHK